MKRSISVGVVALGLSLSVGVAIASCGGTTANGGGSSGTGSASGTVSGVTLNVEDAVAISENGTPGVDATAITIELFDFGGVCAFAQSLPHNADKASYTAIALVVGLQSTGTSRPPVTPGTYAVGPITIGSNDGGAPATMSAFAEINKNDAQCNRVITGNNALATAGTVTITSISTGGVVGSYDVTFPGGTMQGSFNASFCSIDAGTSGSSDAGKTCVP